MPELLDFANPPTLAPGVIGYSVETEKGLYIPMISAVSEGSGEVGTFLDSLPVDRRVVFSSVLSARLKGMLERRGFVAGTEYSEEAKDVFDIMVREPKGT